ncbi:hypothetical protein P154DRAFT_543084 [Amniculicola lignicola CBS 123094]|uniref:Hyaluronan/mRNA-binding protein domain-containing protein n=1 Tax=Amniculicola lignicola CBS 123094 TaxID=1392246 RepID=A0A6A5WT19_9PLEO|nr:hypothetical protein P154DRAFT_543084 [Amniculicola lignicola CBS 123094]
MDLFVTRSHKFTDRDHAGLANGTAEPEEHLPRFFAKSGHSDEDPTKTKKNGGGKGNWGHEGDEVEDYQFNMNHPRRRSNSNTHTLKDFKTKFETVEPEVVFEEDVHGPMPELDKQSTVSSTNSAGSVEDEDNANKHL